LTTVQLKEEHAVTLGWFAWFESTPDGPLFPAKPNVGNYNLRRLKPKRIEGVALSPITGPAPSLNENGAAELLKVLENLKESGLWPPILRNALVPRE
jgi:hypothetical protein